MIASCRCRIFLASVMAMPGTLVGMKSSEPSLSGGMNSEPIRWSGYQVAARTTRASRKRQPFEAQGETDERPVDPDQKPVDRIPVLGGDAAADEPDHQHGHERHREQRGEEHREGLGVGQRLEQTARLRLQRKHRHERNGDDEQREEQRLADLLGGARPSRPVRVMSAISRSVGSAPRRLPARVCRGHGSTVQAICARFRS